jgi:methylenetetrahydrofolate reductase (NADPH)
MTQANVPSVDASHPACAEAQRIAAFTHGFSIEATRPSGADIDAIRAAVPAATRVYLSAVPNRPVEECITAAAAARAAGLEPVPHIAARNFPSTNALGELFRRLAAEAAVREVMIIAGDRDAPAGPLQGALDIITSGLLQPNGIGAIGIAGYPDGHPQIPNPELERLLAAKLKAAQQAGLQAAIVTQFGFDGAPILRWIERLRSIGIDRPIRLGLAGPTSLTTLLRYAARCGVQASTQALVRRTGLMRQMFSMTTPDGLIRTLAAANVDGRLGVVTPHFFSFGGIPATSRWAAATARAAITLDDAGGFQVAPGGETR